MRTEADADADAGAGSGRRGRAARPPQADRSSDATAPNGPAWRGRAPALLLAVLAAQFTVLGLVQAWQDAPTNDEGIYLAAGVTALVRHDLRINVEHPPLSKVLAAAPALLAGPVVPEGPAWEEGKQFTYGTRFVQAQAEAGLLRRLVFLTRLVGLAEGLAVAALAYLLAAELFGRPAGVLAAATWLTLPFALGLSHLQSIDVAFTLVTLAVALTLARQLRAPSPGRLAALGAACGAALLVRHTGVPLVAVAVAVLALSRRPSGWRALGDAAVVAVLAVALLWGGYRALAPGGSQLPAFEALEVLYPNAPPDAPAPVVRALELLPLPAEYELGVRYLGRISLAPAPVFLLGETWTGARWEFWPGSAAVKLGGATLLLLGLGALAWVRLPRRVLVPAAVALVLPALALAALTVNQPRPLGLRYLLPVIALAVVAAGPLARWWPRVGGKVVILGLVGVQLVSLWASHPHSLAWTAPPFAPGYRFTSDTNLDWGQDYYRLREWSRGRDAAVTDFGVGTFDTASGNRPFVGSDYASTRGWVAVGASVLTVYKRDELSWLRAYCPVGTIGGSTLLYFFAAAPDLAPGPVTPAPPCDGEVSVRTG